MTDAQAAPEPIYSLRFVWAAAIAYLFYHSDLPYLAGFTRRRRDGTYGA